MSSPALNTVRRFPLFCFLLPIFLMACTFFLFTYLELGGFFRPGKFYSFDIGVGPGTIGWFGLGFWEKLGICGGLVSASRNKRGGRMKSSFLRQKCLLLLLMPYNRSGSARLGCFQIRIWKKKSPAKKIIAARRNGFFFSWRGVDHSSRVYFCHRVFFFSTRLCCVPDNMLFTVLIGLI